MSDFHSQRRSKPTNLPKRPDPEDWLDEYLSGALRNGDPRQWRPSAHVIQTNPFAHPHQRRGGWRPLEEVDFSTLESHGWNFSGSGVVLSEETVNTSRTTRFGREPAVAQKFPASPLNVRISNTTHAEKACPRRSQVQTQKSWSMRIFLAYCFVIFLTWYTGKRILTSMKRKLGGKLRLWGKMLRASEIV